MTHEDGFPLGPTTLRPNGTRPPKAPETFGEALAVCIDLVADELDTIRDLAANGNRQLILTLGGLQEEVHESRAEVRESMGRIEKLLTDLSTDLEQHQRAVNERLAKLERGAANGHAPAE